MTDNTNYQRIEKAIEFITKNYKEQPSLEEVAEFVHLSPFHFQRIFSEWVGTTPKSFLQYVTLQHAQHLLRKPELTLFDATHELGLTSTSRLHDLFVKIEGMTPAEYKNEGENLHIHYSFFEGLFGLFIVASTLRGVCHLSFCDTETNGLMGLKARFPNAIIENTTQAAHENVRRFFENPLDFSSPIKLHLKSTPFQLKVWEALLKIPIGDLTTYGNIAKEIDNEKAFRAVGTAIGQNPIAFIIPCHRVIQRSGQVGNYMWGSSKKTAIIGWEGCRINAE
jgi:AraC family transcriptional regulator of adaptative response/methylated-DNA-[protein]-cysteine methyltransferase